MCGNYEINWNNYFLNIYLKYSLKKAAQTSTGSFYVGCAYNCTTGSVTYSGTTYTIVKMATCTTSDCITVSASGTIGGYTATCKATSLFQNGFIQMLIAISSLMALYASKF